MPLARAWCSVCYFENTYRPSEIREEEATSLMRRQNFEWPKKEKKKESKEKKPDPTHEGRRKIMTHPLNGTSQQRHKKQSAGLYSLQRIRTRWKQSCLAVGVVGMGGPTVGDACDGSECSNDDVCWAGEGRRRCYSRLFPTVEEADRMNNCRLPRLFRTHALEPPHLFFFQRKTNNPT